jgi:hypothetical protein
MGRNVLEIVDLLCCVAWSNSAVDGILLLDKKALRQAQEKGVIFVVFQLSRDALVVLFRASQA